MDPVAVKNGKVLESVARGLARAVVSRHEEEDPTLGSRFGSGWRSEWETDVRQRLEHLAQAVSVRRPILFAHAIGWTRGAYAAREITNDDLVRHLKCLRAVLQEELAKDLFEAISPFLTEAADRIREEGDASPPPTGSFATQSPRARLVLEYIENLLDGRRDAATKLILDTIEGGAPIREIYEHVLLPAQAEIGNMWHRAEVSISDEHYATATTQMVMSRARSWFPAPEKSDRRMLAFTVGGDLHEIGIRMVSEFFELDGWNAYYLGANIPAADALHAIGIREPHLVAISLHSLLHLTSLAELIANIKRENPEIRVLVGGTPFMLVQDLYEEIGADGWGRSPSEAVELGNSLVPAEDRSSR